MSCGTAGGRRFWTVHSADNGLASFWLADFDIGAWRSPATGWWLVVENTGAFELGPGSLVVVTEGRRPVAYFHVEQVRLTPDDA